MKDNYIVKYAVYRIKGTEDNFIKGYTLSKCYYLNTFMKNGEIKHKVLLPFDDLVSFEDQFPFVDLDLNFVSKEVDDIYDNYEDAKEQVDAKNKKAIDIIKRFRPNNEGLLNYAIECLGIIKEYEKYIEEKTEFMQIGKTHQKRLSRN